MSAIGSAGTSLDSDAWVMFPARIRAVRSEIQAVSTYELQLENAEARRRFAFRSGQFNMLYVPGIGEAAISISSDPHENESVLHTVRAVGNVTRASRDSTSATKFCCAGRLARTGPWRRLKATIW